MEDFARILFVVPGQLGDVLLATPAIRAAREHWPAARIDVLGYEGTLDLLQGNPDLDRLIEMPTGRSHWPATLKLALRLWRRYDFALALRTGDRGHLAALLAAGRRSVLWPADAGAWHWKRRLAHHGFVAAADTSAVLAGVELLRPWFDPPTTLSVQPPPPEPLPAGLEAQLRRPCVIVHPPSMWRYKQWPLAGYRRVVEALLSDGTQVVLSGGASANDMASAEALRDAGDEPDLIVAAGRLRMRQLRALMARADAYVGPDSSVTHLAAAVGLPVVAMYGPSQPQHFGPWPRGHAPQQPWQRRAQRQQVGRVVLLQGPDRPDRPSCVPCNGMGCDQHRDSPSHCLESLSPERVLAEVRALLRAAGATPRSRLERVAP